MADEEILLEQTKPIIVETKGKWLDFEFATQQNFEIGKTYKITLKGDCMFAISPTKPEEEDFISNRVWFTKKEGKILWIKTREGEKQNG